MSITTTTNYYYVLFFTAYVSLWFLVFAGFACNYMIRINLNIAIVDMTAVKSKGQTILMCGDPAVNASGDGVKKDLYTKKKVWKKISSISRVAENIYFANTCFAGVV